MQSVETISALRAQIKAWRDLKQTIAFVPTMGNLHHGHLSLVRKASELADRVVVSIFVNPLQFDDKADLFAYPRTVMADIHMLSTVDCDVIFTPTIDVMYPKGMAPHTNIIVPNMNDKLCGLKRPGHFDGVATVVTKLLNIVQADIALFGEKDYQQLLLIKRLIRDLNLPVDILGSPTFREESGLAMSSRNQYLTEQQREQASGLYQTLLSFKQRIVMGEQDFPALQLEAITKLEGLGFEAEYVDIRRADDLTQAISGDKNLRILAAARLGKARLIDNIACNLA
ncbi:MAG: pantoate--beta-alanine ligase [Pseudomonadota bacterium]|nr:pantoate--beta-alanine ligase [Pseudomonadota bacterium]